MQFPCNTECDNYVSMTTVNDLRLILNGLCNIDDVDSLLYIGALLSGNIHYGISSKYLCSI
jgi:hypothetical protein